MDVNKLLELDKKHIWHPCSQMKDYEEFKPELIKRGEGVWLITESGKRILDAVSSWWVNLFGHANKYISQKIAEQAMKLEHVIFANFTHVPAIKLTVSLTKLFNGMLPKVFFTDNGSAAVEAALKMSYQYYKQSGFPGKKEFIYITGAYHGETLGALAVGSLGLYKKIFEPLLMKTTEASGPDCYRCPFGLERETCRAECFSDIETLLQEKHDSTAGVIIEPMLQAAAGMKMYSPVYLKKLRKTCTELNVHLICDEIAAGFGRTGKMMASHHAGIVPDITTVSKGITAGYLPLAAVLTNNRIFDAFYADYTDMKGFMHSHSYTGNPLACSAGNAVFDIFEKDNILKKNINKGKYIRECAMSIQKHKNVGDIRTLGMVTAIELVADKKTKKSFDWKKRLGYRIYRNAVKKGVLLRNLGDIIYFMPPYIINRKEIEFMVNTAKQAVNEVLG